MGLVSDTVFINEQCPQTWTSNHYGQCNFMGDLILKRFNVQDGDGIVIVRVIQNVPAHGCPINREFHNNTHQLTK